MDKLTINRETIRNLSSEELKGVVGGINDTTSTPGAPAMSAAASEGDTTYVG